MTITVDVLLTEEEHRAALHRELREGLTRDPKRISPVWFYDERGSDLFDEITRLPEYYLTRAEWALLEAHGAQVAEVTAADTLVELGSGTSEKTTLLLDALEHAGTLKRYVPLDVSEQTLRAAAAELANSHPEMEVHGVVGNFLHHLGDLPHDGRRLVAFLGSTIGNLDPNQRGRFLLDLNTAMEHDDHLLVGLDLAKDPERLVAAYDDAQGLTAEFNRNALHVMNKRLAADFDPDSFEHVAVWNGEHSRMDIRLRSTLEQTVTLPALDLTVTFERGEDLQTEISTKFTLDGFTAELEKAGFTLQESWTGDGDFLLLLARPWC